MLVQKVLKFAHKQISILLLFLIVASISSFAQAISGKIADSIAGTVIPYATIIYINHASIGAYADDEGKFSIPFFPDDTLVVSAIGYRSKKIAAAGMVGKSVLLKLPSISPDLLPEVVIKKDYKQRKSKLLGYAHLTRGMMTGSTKGAKIMVEIPNIYGNSKQIVELIFVLGNASDNIHHRKSGRVRICLYALDSNCNKIGETLLKRDIVVTVPKPILTHKLKIDLSKEGLFMPHCGVFVGLEFLGAKKESHQYNINPAFWLTDQPYKYRTYYEFFGKEKMYKKDDGNYPMFGIRIR